MIPPVHCELCPRRCGVDRVAGRTGYCGAGNRPLVFRYGAHHGEEPPVSGTRGSGTIFFSRCTLRCLYCQNYRWSQGGEGREYDAGGLAGIMESLADTGCHNWNLVSPTPWLPWILEARETLATKGIALPMVYNTSGYERVEVLEGLAGKIALYLTDLRYSSAATAAEASCAADYVEMARNALLEMWRQTGPIEVDRDGIAVSGTICRILVLPGRAREAVDNLRWIGENIGVDIPVSVMCQYHPAHRAVGQDVWGRNITHEEYDLVSNTVSDIGFTGGWVQEIGKETSSDLLGWEMRPGGGAGFDEERECS